MAIFMDNKADLTVTETIPTGKPRGSHHVENVRSVALAAALAEQKPAWWSKNMLQLYMVVFVGYMISSLNGFDGSLMGSINAMPYYQSTFNLDGAGSGTGIVFIVYNLGYLAAVPFCSLIADGYGRRWSMFIGCLIVLIGTAVQVTANTTGQFIGGRFVLGMGAVTACATAPAYVVELSHPSARGTMAGMYNNFWWVGNIIASWTTYGTNLHIHSDWSWRLPTILQCALPAMSMALVLFLPESPRWLMAQNREDEAAAIFTKYHGNNDSTAPIVALQMDEIRADLLATADHKPWWNYIDLVSTRDKRYRFGLVVVVALFGQWSGNNVVSYFLPEMMKIAGITQTNKQFLINATLSIFGMLSAVIGALMLDRLGRRKMLLFSLIGCLFSYVLLTAFTAVAPQHPNLAYGTIVSVFLFIIAYAWAWTPLATLYPVECLENRTRIKGSALMFFWLNIATVTNTYGISVGIERLGWKLYLIFLVWLVIEIIVVFLFFVETKGKTLEELRDIFNAKNPVKESMKTTTIVATDEETVYDISEKN